MRTLLIIALLATVIPAADLSFGGSIGAGYSNWNGWGGYSMAASVGPSLAIGQFGLSADFLLGQSKVTKNGPSTAFWNFGGLARVRYSVLQVGAGYGYIPGFTNETGGYYAGTGSPLLAVGVVFPLRLTNQVSLSLGAENVFATSLASFYNPSAQLGLAYRFPRAEPRPVPKGGKPAVPVKEGPVAGKPRPAFPPKLETRVEFEETGRRNQALDAEEQAYFVVTVKNSGKGKADSVRVRAEAISSVTGISVGIGRVNIIPEISPGGTGQAIISLVASEDVPDQEIRFRISAIEPVFGADALPNVITITSRAIAPPDLVAYDNAISDDMSESEWAQGNGNGQLELNEQVEVTTLVQNKGIGTAYDVSVTVTPTDPNVLYQSPKSVLSLGDIPAGEWRKLQYPVFVNARFNADTAKLILDIAEQRSRFSRKDTVCIPLNVTMTRPGEVVVQPKARLGSSPVPRPPSLTDSLLIDIPKGRQNPDAFAVVIGAANYREVTKVEYAAKDADAMREYLIEAFGYLDGNIITLPDPTSGDLNRVFGTAANPEGQLYNLVSAKPGRCDVFVYYAGHGAPSVREKKGYLVPIDASPDYIEQNGYPLDLFYTNLSKVPTRNLTVVLDACFSGETPDANGRVGTLVQHASPVPVASVSEEVPVNSLVMAAAKSNQLACWYPDKGHSLFTYFLLKGLKGEADLNKDGRIVVRELDEYMNRNVPPLARLLYNRDQTPEIRGAAGAELLKLK
jgi:hypothetical protein